MTYDLILRGGRVVDPLQKLDAVTDVAFSDGKVARIGAGLQAAASTDVRDVSGRIVTPGLIDLHTHVYWGGTSLGIDAEDFCRSSGVTTAVDTGSAGPGNFAGFRKHVIERSDVRILAYLHVSFAGIFAFSPRVMVGESEEIRLMAPIDAAEVADANRDIIVGIKVRVGARASGRSGTVPLDIAHLADVASVSEAHFIRTFKATFGETPHRYLQRRRVERAMFLLRETERSITDICMDVGFNSLGTFSRTFRDIVGESPTTYRAQAHVTAAPTCFTMAWMRPSSFGEAGTPNGH